MIADMHVHTAFSCDSEADMEQYVEHAQEKKKNYHIINKNTGAIGPGILTSFYFSFFTSLYNFHLHIPRYLCYLPTGGNRSRIHRHCLKF